ncbi:MAG: hypothetical protein RI955_813, partial [Bacteroidota bacterium]
MKNIFLFLIAILLFTACQKQPTANFNFDKSTYNAGETVHLTDASTNAHRWYWVMPDGSSQTSKNVDYIIGANDVDKPFTLITTSRNGKKVSSIPKTIDANHFIFNSDFFSIYLSSTNTRNNYKPVYKTAIAENGKWHITAWSNYTVPSSGGLVTGIDEIDFFLPNGTPPTTSGIYTLKSTNSNLSSNEVNVLFRSGDGEN